MTNDHQKPREENAVGVSSVGISVPDASHPRFLKPYRCTDTNHTRFAMNKVHDHFSKYKHKSVSLCQHCESNEVFEYYNVNEGRQHMKFYCCECKMQCSAVIDHAREIERGDPISQSLENSIYDSSGIGTELSSSMSINSEQSDGQSTSHNMSCPSLSGSTSIHNGSPNGSHND